MNSTVKFLKECSLEQFTDWLKEVCIDDSFNNIEDKMSFRTIVINTTDIEGERLYYIISLRDNITNLYNTFKDYTTLPVEKQEEFNLNENTRLFIYSTAKQFITSKHPYLTELKDSLTDDQVVKYEYAYDDMKFDPYTDTLITSTDVFNSLTDILKSIDSKLLHGLDYDFKYVDDAHVLTTNDALLKDIADGLVFYLQNDSVIRNYRNLTNKELYNVFGSFTAFMGNEKDKLNVIPVNHEIFNGFNYPDNNVFEYFDIIEPMYNLFKDNKYTYEEFINRVEELLHTEGEVFKVLYNNLSTTNFLLLDDHYFKIFMDMRGSSILDILNEINKED